MNTKTSTWSILSIIAIATLISLYVYPDAPDTMASHWNALGEVDGYMSKRWALILMPVIAIFMYGMFILIPKIDPLKKNIESFRRYYNALIVVLTIFLLYIHSLMVVWNMGYHFDMGQYMIPAIGLLFIYIGSMLKYAKRNWFIGIRTPWTLSSDVVWGKVHALGGKLFQVAGLIAFAGFFFPRVALAFIIVPIVGITVYLIIYSYFLYRKEGQKSQKT